MLDIKLPEAASPIANYLSYVVNGNMVYISGQISKLGDNLIAGKLGKDISVEAAKDAARICGLNLLAQLKKACDGDLSRVKRCVRLGVFVNSTLEFIDHPPIANGVSDLMVEVFGEAGKHARSTIGLASLPLGAAVEVEGLFELQ